MVRIKIPLGDNNVGQGQVDSDLSGANNKKNVSSWLNSDIEYLASLLTALTHQNGKMVATILLVAHQNWQCCQIVTHKSVTGKRLSLRKNGSVLKHFKKENKQDHLPSHLSVYSKQ